MKLGTVAIFLLIFFNYGAIMKLEQDDLFEWAKHMENKYGINEEQLILPFVNNDISVPKKEQDIKILDEDDGYCD